MCDDPMPMPVWGGWSARPVGRSRMVGRLAGLVLMLSLPMLAAAAEATGSAGPDATAVLPLEDSVLKTEAVDVQLIAPEEFKPAIRDNLPELVEKRQIEAVAADSPYVLLPHRPNYVLPVSWQAHPDNGEIERLLDHFGADESDYQNADLDHVEAVFQLSIKYVVAEGVLNRFGRIQVAYTNRSFWQSYNDQISKPFRETNHEPEILYTWQPGAAWIDQASIGFNHQSNGQTSTLSRSWNRVIVGGTSVFSRQMLSWRAWWRIPESGGADPDNPADDDNPDIEQYLGYGDLTWIRVYGNHNLSVMLRNNLDRLDNRGAVELGWTFPLTRKLKGYVLFFDGYGDSLIDYNHYQQRLGIGIKLSDWL